MNSHRSFLIGSVMALLVLPLIGACYLAPVVPPPGGVFSNIEAPLDIDFAETQLGMKKGEAETKSVLGMVAWGDASTGEAARNGGIQTIKHADYSYFNVIGVYQRFTVTVYGD